MIDQRTFPNDNASVTAARRYVLGALGEVAAATADAVALMVSELTANAVRHSRTQFTVMLDQTDTRIRIAVSDSGPGRPVVRAPGPTEPSGRGLQIVEALADEWGIDPASEGDGKTVWFAIELPEGPEDALQRGRESVSSFESSAHASGSLPNAATTNPSHGDRPPRARRRSCPTHARARART